MIVRTLTVVAAIAGAALAQERVTVFQGAKVMTGDGTVHEGGVVIAAGGKIQVVGDAGTAIPSGAVIVDCSDKVITPGLVDASTYLGVSRSNLNEQGDEITPHMQIIDALNPADPRFARALHSGVTTVQVSPGNRNVIGGLGAVVKTAGNTVAEMLILNESGLRMAMGGEPSSGNRAIRGGTPQGIYYRRPTTRMGVVWEVRKAFYDAQEYQERKTVDQGAGPSMVDPGMEVLVRALNKEVMVRTTARAEHDIRTALRLAEEFGYKTLIEEGTEAWRVVDELVEAKMPVLFAAPSAMSAADGAEVRYHTLNVLASRDVPFAICTGSNVGAMTLVHEAMFAVRHGLDSEAALAAVTSVPASLLGVADRVGTLAAGFDADMVVWNGDPFDPTTSVSTVYLGGREVQR